jgi:hypothetical protein
MEGSAASIQVTPRTTVLSSFFDEECDAIGIG